MAARGLILAAVAGLALAGCDRTPETPAPSPGAPATRTADVPAPASKPAESNAQFLIRLANVPDQLIEFPPARMVVQVKDEQTRLTLFSKDPVTTRQGEYQGNSFWFEASFDVSTVDALAGSEFAWKNSYNDRLDTNTGLFLRAQHVQPLEAVLRLERDGDAWVALIQGTFQVFSEGIDDKPATIVNVTSRLVPEVIIKP